MSTDDFAARLRRATADVPASALDLEDVLESARGKARRVRVVSGLATVLVVGLLGAGAWEAGPLLDRGGDDRAGAVAAGDAVLQGRCSAPQDVAVTVRSVESQPSVVAVLRTTVDAQGSVLGEHVVPLDQDVSGIVLRAASAPQPYRTAIMRAAQDPDGPLTALGAPAADQPPRAEPAHLPNEAEPGTYVSWSGGQRYTAHGLASCDGSGEPFTLTYVVTNQHGTLECGLDAAASDEFATHLAIAWCPDGELTDDQRHWRAQAEHDLGGPEALRDLQEHLGVVRP